MNNLSGAIGWAAVNGSITPLAEAAISVTDLGFLRGLAAFESLRSYHGAPHALDRHLDRLWHSARHIGVDPCLELDQCRRLIKECQQRCLSDAQQLDDSSQVGNDVRINIIVTPGPHQHGVFHGGPATSVIIVKPLIASPAQWYQDGVKATTFRGERVLAELKTTTYITGLAGLQAAEDNGAHEAIYCNTQGNLVEGVTSNILIREGQHIIEPDEAHLAGITQQNVRAVCQESGYTWAQEAITFNRACHADEMWCCSAFRELVPVVQIDNHPIGNGRVGPAAGTIRHRLQERCISESLSDDQA